MQYNSVGCLARCTYLQNFLELFKLQITTQVKRRILPNILILAQLFLFYKGLGVLISGEGSEPVVCADGSIWQMQNFCS